MKILSLLLLQDPNILAGLLVVHCIMMLFAYLRSFCSGLPVGTVTSARPGRAVCCNAEQGYGGAEPVTARPGKVGGDWFGS